MNAINSGMVKKTNVPGENLPPLERILTNGFFPLRSPTSKPPQAVRGAVTLCRSTFKTTEPPIPLSPVLSTSDG